ncbi:MAG: dynamin family protein [Cecembia sp.]
MDQFSHSNTKKEGLNLIGLCADIRKIATKNNFNAPLTELRDIVDKLKSQTIYIVILGLFKRGKSSIINAILDADIAPVAITPLTSVITFFKFGESKKAEVFFEDGTSKKVEIHGIEEFISEDLNPENIKKVKQVNVYYPSELLKNLILVDTPGLGSLYEHNSLTTTSFIPKIDAALYVLSADLPISAADGNFLKSVSKHIPKIVYLLNKKDLVSKEDLEKLKAFNARNIAKQTGQDIKDIDLIALSAKQFTASTNVLIRKQSGILELKQQLMTLGQTQGIELAEASAANRINMVIHQMVQLLNWRLATYNSPIQELEEQSRELKRSLDIIQSNQGDFLSIIKNRNQVIMDEVTALVNQNAKEIKSKYKALLTSEHGAEIVNNSASTRKFLDQLNRDISEVFSQLHQKIELQVKQKFQEIMLGFLKQSQHYLNELSANLEKQLGIKLDMIIGKFDLDVYSPFYIRSIPEYSIPLPKSNPFLYLLPKKIVQKRLVNSVLSELDKIIIANSAGMLYDIRYRMDESLRKMVFDLNLKTSELINELIAILSRSKEEKLHMEEDIKYAIKKIKTDLLEIEKLKTRL